MGVLCLVDYGEDRSPSVHARFLVIREYSREAVEAMIPVLALNPRRKGARLQWVLTEEALPPVLDIFRKWYPDHEDLTGDPLTPSP